MIESRLIVLRCIKDANGTETTFADFCFTVAIGAKADMARIGQNDTNGPNRKTERPISLMNHSSCDPD